MIRGNRILAGLVLALLVVGALSGAAALAEEGAQQNETSEEDAGVQLVKDEGEEEETTSAQPEPEGQGTVEIDPESAAGLCPGGTALKIDNLRSNGTFGPITISDFTNTSFTWTSTEGVSAVLVKDGGGHKTNPGGSSGSASTFGQDISHVIFCLGGEVDAETPDEEEPCDGDDTMPGTQPCEPAPCDADETMPGTQPCEPAPCDGDETMPGTQPCEPAPCDGDETMPGTQPCAPALCDADETMPGRQDCTQGVAGVESKPKKSEGDDVRAAGLAAGGEPDVAPMAAQPLAAQPAVQGAVLPFTGGQVVPLLMVAVGLVSAGSGAVLIRRP